MSASHIPVLLNEAVDGLAVEQGNLYIDATLGGGGHTEEILLRGGRVLGIDQDSDVLSHTSVRIRKTYPDEQRVMFAHGNFAEIEQLAKQKGIQHADGILMDLGISSIQLDTPERGFSYRFTDAPLDLRMDQAHGDTAAQLVNRLGEGELYDIFSSFGEEQRSRTIAHAISVARSVKPIESVGDILDIIRTIVPHDETRIGVQARIFQALRIAVNDELGSLKKGLIGASGLLKPGGRLVIISFHSLEDRIVKQFLRKEGWTVLTKHPMRPSETEMERNPRARSAKLRIAERIRI